MDHLRDAAAPDYMQGELGDFDTSFLWLKETHQSFQCMMVKIFAEVYKGGMPLALASATGIIEVWKSTNFS